MLEHFSPQTLAYEGFRGLNMPLADAFLNILLSLSVMSWMLLTTRFCKDNMTGELFCTYCPTIIKPLTFLILQVNQHWGDYSHCQVTGSWLTRFFRHIGLQLWFPTSSGASQGYRNKAATAAQTALCSPSSSLSAHKCNYCTVALLRRAGSSAAHSWNGTWCQMVTMTRDTTLSEVFLFLCLSSEHERNEGMDFLMHKHLSGSSQSYKNQHKKPQPTN